MGWLFFSQDVSSKLGLIWKSVSLGPAGQGRAGTTGGVSSGGALLWDTPPQTAAPQTWDSHRTQPSVPCIQGGGELGTLLAFLRKKKQHIISCRLTPSYCGVKLVCVFALIDNYHKSEETLHEA